MSSAPTKASTSKAKLNTESREHIIHKSPHATDFEMASVGAQDVPTVEENGEWISGLKLLNIIAALTFVCLLMLLDSSIIVTAVPSITSDFHSLPDVGWYGGAYQLSSATLQPLTRKLYMNFEAKWTFMAFFFIFELGSLICGVATSSKMLIVGRAIAGMGTSGIMNGAMIIIAQCVPMEKRPSLIGIAMGVSQLGLILGPLVGGLLTQYVSWRWCFYINLPFGGLIAVMLAFVRIPEPIPKPSPISVLRSLPSKLDLIGFAIFAPAAIMLLLALQYGGVTFAWDSSEVIGLFCGAAATFIVFLNWDKYKGDDAMIPFSMARRMNLWSSCLVYGLLMGQLFCASYYLPIYFQGVRGVSPTMSGVYLLPSILSHILAAVSSGILLQRVGYYIPISVLSAAIGAVANGLISTFSPSTQTGRWIGYQIVLGFGRGLGLQMPIIAVQNTIPAAQLPLAMALIMCSQSMGGALFLSFCDTIFTNSLRTLIPRYAPSVDAQSIVNAGATGFRKIVTGADLAGVLVAYAKSVDRVFYLTAGMAVGCAVFAWGMGWKDIRKKNEESKA